MNKEFSLLQLTTWDSLPDLIKGKGESEQFQVLRDFFGVQDVEKSDSLPGVAYISNSEGKRGVFVIGHGLVKFPHLAGTDPYFTDQAACVLATAKAGTDIAGEKVKIIVWGIQEAEWYSWLFDWNDPTVINHVRLGSDAITGFQSYEEATRAAGDYYLMQRTRQETDKVLSWNDAPGQGREKTSIVFH